MNRTPSKTNERAAALVVVVAFLVLLSALVVYFYTRVGTELVGSRGYAQSVSVRQLADIPYGVVMSQIREATTVKRGAWVVQPGMIRVYGTGKEAGPEAHAFFKLYSSHDLIISKSEMAKFEPWEYDQAAKASALEVPLGKGGWREQPAFFVDLNQKVMVPARDPDARAAGKLVPRYPILDPSVAGLHDPAITDHERFERPWQVEGVAIGLPRKLRDDPALPSSNEAPMPVRWIYVLRDGTLTTPSPIEGPAEGREGFRAIWSTAGGNRHGIPTKTNPIVGRIAFWTDDDTNKVNANTAGGSMEPLTSTGAVDDKANLAYAGSYYDTPHFQTLFDRGLHDEQGRVIVPSLANSQPAQNEFQRYAGHPATVSLPLVFKDLLKKVPHGKEVTAESFYMLSPRLMPGGSRGGQVRVDSDLGELPIKSGRDKLDFPLNPLLNGKTFHFFESTDEMLYSSENSAPGGNRQRAETFLGLPSGTITADLFDRTRFFLTTHSRAPELNLFGQPRVVIWPVRDEPVGTRVEVSLNNPTDALIRFCSRIGGKDFIFSRRDPYSTTVDFNLPRNREVFDYLRAMTSRQQGRIPGFGGSFEEKFATAPGGRDQLLTEIFDYIRTVNLKDTSRAKEIAASALPESQKRAEQERVMYAPRGYVVSTRVDLNGTKLSGFGRFPTITEASIVFYHAGWVGRLKENPESPEVVIQDPELLPKYDVKDKLVRAFLIFETFNPMQGYAPVSSLNGTTEKLVHELSLSRDFTLQSENMPEAKPLGFPRQGRNQIVWASGSTWGGRSFGGTEGFFHTVRDKSQPLTGANSALGQPWPVCTYDFRTQSNERGTGISGVRVPVDDQTFAFSGGRIDLAITFNGQTIQSIPLALPAAKGWPLPRGINPTERTRLERASGRPLPVEGNTDEPAIWPDLGGFANNSDLSNISPRPAIRREWAYSFERRLAWLITSAGRDLEHSYGPWEMKSGGDGKFYTNRWRNLLQPGDTIRSVVPGNADDPTMADPRVLALQNVAEDIFQPHPDYFRNLPRAQSLRRGDGQFYFPPAAPYSGALLTLDTPLQYNRDKSPDLPVGVVAMRLDGMPADFDTGIGNYPDGGFCGKPDEGNVTWRWFDQNTQQWVYVDPYFSTHAYDPPQDTHFSPNRQLPSAVAFGSLLSRGRGWETLLFAPNPAGANHPGLTSPRDHLLLDLFTMPVVEPFAISEPFSKAGQVNMNYQLMPFGYIERSIALRAALQSVRVTAVPTVNVGDYKSQDLIHPRMGNVRYPVDRDQTLKAFDDFFAEFKTDRNKGLFKSASEICDRFLYPKGETHVGKVPYRGKGEANMRTFWKASALTGDNLREKPYADLYPKLTTKSNTFTVHYRVQTLKQRAFDGKGDEAAYYASWDEERDTMLSELRGQTSIERFLDAEDRRFSAERESDRIDVEKQSLEDVYRFRIISQKPFSPW